MKKVLKNYHYALLVFFFCIFSFTSGYSVVKAESTKDIPTIEYIVLENMPFIEGISNALYISSKNYSNDIQYQVLYKCTNIPNDALKIVNNDNTINGWTNPTKANELYRVDISKLKLSSGNYKFYVRIKRTGRVGVLKSIYGNYDSEHSLTLNVIKKSNIDEKIKVQIDKKHYAKSDYITFGNLDNPLPNILYKFHLYDLKNKKWLSNLTEYNYVVNYNLSNMPCGTYLVDLWYKNLLSQNSYDGWKLSLIQIEDETSIRNHGENTLLFNEFTRMQSNIQEKLYEYLTNEENRELVKKRAFSLNGNSQNNSCVYFVSEALRRVGIDLNDRVCFTGQLNDDGSNKNISLTYQLLKRGWKYSRDSSLLMPGDICFSTPFGGGEGRPTHSYIFMGWVENDNMEYAYVCDNQVSDYGSIYHIRNIKNPTPDKESFYYFMYKNVNADE